MDDKTFNKIDKLVKEWWEEFDRLHEESVADLHDLRTRDTDRLLRMVLARAYEMGREDHD